MGSKCWLFAEICSTEMTKMQSKIRVCMRPSSGYKTENIKLIVFRDIHLEYMQIQGALWFFF